MPTEPVLGTETGGPGLAFGLNGISDWGPAQAFLNVFKTARDWTGHLPGQWGGVDVEDMTAQGVLDENGYPTRMPDDVTHLQTFVMTELPAEATYAAGRYRLTYEGTGELTVDWGASNVTYGDGEIWFDYTPNGENMVAISIRSTDTSGTGDHLRNIELVKEEHIPAYDAGETFNPLWLDLVDDVHALRFMDWMSTNNSTVVSWDDRPTPDMYSYDSGVPVEIMVELANQTSAEPWFNIPHNADDDYIRQFAQYVRDNLDPDLRAHFEFSNEVWNFTFGQARDSAADAEIRFGGEVEAGWVQEYGARSAEMAMILDDVYAGEEDRLVKTIATHTGWPGLESAILEAPDYVALDPANAAPYTLFDTYAVTGYFGYGLGANKAEAVLSWIAESRTQAETQADALGLAGAERSAYVEAHKFDLATDRAIQELRDGSVTGDPSSSLAELFDTFAYHAAVAEEYGLDMVMYEGGTHVVATGQYTGDPVLSEFFIELNYSDAMGQLYTELLDGWVDAGGTLFNAFVEVAKPSQWGSWGNLRHLGDDTARHDALVEFLDTYPRLDRGGEVVDPDPVANPVDPVPDPAPVPDPVDPAPDPDPVPDPVDPVPDPDPQTGGKAVREYIFGHSLINHVSDTPATVVPWWMDAFAEASGDNSYAFSGQWGGLQNHDDLPLRPQWGLNGVEDAWDPDAGESLADADFTHFTITALNFVQYQGPDQAYWNEPNTTPISATLDIIDHVIGQEPDATILIYENWPDMARFVASFPPTRAEFDTWCDYLRGEFNDWWVTYESALSDARPDVDIRLVPVGPMLADMLQSPDLGLADIPLTDLFVDDAPHGTASLYFLASIVQYTALYGELPPADFAVPDGVHPDIAAAFPEILTFVAENSGLLSDDPGVDEPAVIETTQNTAVTFDLLADDDQAVLIDAVKEEPAHGSIALNPTGTLTYTPNAFWFGTDSFTYEYIDLSGETVTADASVTVQGPEGHVIGDVQLDTAGTKPWSERFLTYDAAGDKVAVTVTRDDGTVVHTAFANDVRTNVEMLDPDDAVSWTRVQKEYDASGAVTHQTVHHDDGRIVATDLAGGVRSISMMTDSSDAFSWGSQTAVYDSSGALTSRKRVMDNGVEHVSTFEDGVKVREVSEDLSDVFVWTRTISDFEASGTVSHRTKTYDDGRLLEIEYVDGIRTEMVLTDVLDAYDWTSRNFVFDAAGDLLTQSTIMDGL